MASTGNDITLKVNVDIKDAQSAMSRFKMTTQRAFSHPNAKIQSMGNQLNKATQNIQNLLTQMHKLATTKVPTDSYIKLQNSLKEVKTAYTQAEKEAKQLSKTPQYTPRYESALAEVENLSKKLKEAKLEQAKLDNAKVDKNSAEYKLAAAQVQKYTEELRKAEIVQETLKKTGQQYQPDSEYKRKLAELQKLARNITMLEKLIKSAEDSGTAFTEQGTKTPEYARLQQRLTNAVNQSILLNNKIAETEQRLADASSQAGNLEGNLNRGTASAGRFSYNINLVTVTMRALNAGVNSVRSAFRTLISLVRTFATTAVSLIRRVSSMFSGLLSKSISSTGKSHNMTFKKMLTTVLKYGFGVRSIFLLYRRVRTTISNGLTELAKQFEEVAVDVDGLKNSWSGFKSSIVSAFQPIFSYVVPALQTLINYLTSAMNALANFFALLTGQNYYYKAKKGNESVAESIDGTGSSADDANEKLAEYDELLVIDQDSSSGGSGGSGSGDSDAWNWEKVATEASDWADMIKDAFTTWDFTAIGSRISDNITKALQSINWNKIYKTASNFGKGFATFLNGLITADLFSEVGKTIANSLNTALTFIYSFTTWFNSAKFGNAIASGINSFINNFNFQGLVKTFGAFAKEILNVLTTAITGVEWKTLGQKIADAIENIDTSGISFKLGKFVNAIVNAIYDLVTVKETWVNLGTKIADGINSFFTTVEWTKLGTTLRETFKGFLTTITVAIEGVDWTAVGEAIRDFIEGIDWKDIKFALGTLKDVLKQAFIELLEGLEINPEDLKKDIIITIGKIALIIAGIASIAFGAGITKSLLTTLASVAFSRLLANIGLSAVGAGTAGAGLSIGSLPFVVQAGLVILAAITGIKIGGILYKVITGDTENYGGFIHQWQEIITHIPDLLKGIKLDITQDGSITFDFINILYQIGKLGSPNPFSVVNLFNYFKNKIKKEGSLEAVIEGSVVFSITKTLMKLWKFGSPTPLNIVDIIAFIKSKLSDNSGDTDVSLNGDIEYSVNDVEVQNSNMIESTLKKLFDHTTTAIEIATTMTGDAESLDDLNAIDTALSGIGSHDNMNSKLNFKLGGNTVTSKRDLDGLTSSFKSLNEQAVDKKVTYSTELGGKISQITDLDSWRIKFNDLAFSWKDTKAVMSVNTGGEIQSINDLTGAGGWKDKFKSLYDSWVGRPATFSTKFSIGDAGSWVTSLNAVKAKWTDTEAKFTTTLTGAVKSGDDFTKLADAFGKLSENFGGEYKASYDISLTGETSTEAIRNYADAKYYLDQWWGSDTTRIAKYSIDFSSSASDVKTYANNVLSKVYDALTKGGFQVKEKVWAARGGILTRATNLIAGEAGAEAIVPLERNLGWLNKMATMISDELVNVQMPLIASGNIIPMSDAFMNKYKSDDKVVGLLEAIAGALTTRSDSDSNNQSIVLQLDSRTVAEVVWDETEKRYKQTGARFAY